MAKWKRMAYGIEGWWLIKKSPVELFFFPVQIIQSHVASRLLPHYSYALPWRIISYFSGPVVTLRFQLSLNTKFFLPDPITLLSFTCPEVIICSYYHFVLIQPVPSNYYWFLHWRTINKSLKVINYFSSNSSAVDLKCMIAETGFDIGEFPVESSWNIPDWFVSVNSFWSFEGTCLNIHIIFFPFISSSVSILSNLY